MRPGGRSGPGCRYRGCPDSEQLMSAYLYVFMECRSRPPPACHPARPSLPGFPAERCKVRGAWTPRSARAKRKTMQRTFCVGFSETECAAQGLGATFAKVDAGIPNGRRLLCLRRFSSFYTDTFVTKKFAIFKKALLSILFVFNHIYHFI